MADQDNEPFVRWQGRTIEQLGFVNNLLIGLATGLFAFSTQLAFGTAILTAATKLGMIVSVTLAFISIIFGCLTAWNRLSSFRITMKVARDRESDQRNNINELRESSRKRDERTWDLLGWQTITFAFGALSLSVIAIGTYLG